MNQKPKIQYIGQFYIHGSEARALELQEQKKQAENNLNKIFDAFGRENVRVLDE